jgi:hypothetical protein
MTLRPIVAEPAVVDAIRTQLPRLVSSPVAGDGVRAAVASPAVALAAAHRVYALGLEPIAAGHGMERAVPVAVRFLLMDGSSAVASVEKVDAPDHGVRLLGGSHAKVLADTIRRADARPEFDGAEIRLLQVSALHLTALWLHALPAGEDVLIPVGHAPKPVDSGEPHTPSRLLDLLRPLARTRLARVDGDIGS